MATRYRKLFFLLTIAILVFGVVAADAYAAIYYRDRDKDTYGDANNYLERAKQPKNYVANSLDCNDRDKKINPAVTEVCGDKKDNNCDGRVDENCAINTYYKDSDADGYGSPTATTTATSQPIGYVSNSNDCNDANAAIYLGATEVCGNGIDEDCSGADLACQAQYKDADSDGYGNSQVTLFGAPTAGYVSNADDCNDADPAINICAADSVCYQGTCAVYNYYYKDADADSFGTPTSVTLSYYQPAGYVLDKTDCNDADATINPLATEACNNKDDNCDGKYDETFINKGTSCSVGVGACQKSGSYVCSADGTGTTCSAVAGTPTTEVCGNSIDEDCSGADLACPTFTFYQDADADSYGGTQTTTATSQPAGYVSNSLDCNDASSAISPGATEVCGDGIDQDCSGDDLACPVTVTCTDTDGGYYVDKAGSCTDSSGTKTDYCYSSSGITEYYCAANSCTYKYVLGSYGCSNGVLALSATLTCTQTNGGVEICGNSIDEDCSGADLACPTPTCTDTDGGTNYFTAGTCTDSAGKTFTDYCLTAAGTVVEFACSAGNCAYESYGEATGSCSSGAWQKCVPATEVCGDGIDQDCDGADTACSVVNTYYKDADADTYGSTTETMTSTSTTPPSGYVSNNNDCNDASAAIHLGATEICGDGIDQDCDGVDTACAAINTYYKDADADTYGSPTATTTATSQPAGYVSNSNDCNDNNASIKPGATETCGNGIDEDCSGADLACTTTTTTCSDSDGSASSAYYTTGTCTDSSGTYTDYCATGTNVVDYLCVNNACVTATSVTRADATCSNGAFVCSDGSAGKNYYYDSDGDGYGRGTPIIACSPQSYYTALVAGDCQDQNKLINPGATEICGNGIDEDCSGADLACTTTTNVTNVTVITHTYYKDADADTYGSPSLTTTSTSTTAPAGYVSNSNDCNDANANIKPGGTEVCGDGIDQDCSGADLACPITTNTTAATTLLINCADTDNGLDYYTAGTCTNRYGEQYADKCLTTTSGVQLYEYYCTSDAVDCSATLHSETGYDCANGKLVPQTTTTSCTDTDGGKIYTTKGTCTDSTGSYTDSCPYSAWVKEYYCTSAGCASVDNTAIYYACSDGALYATSTSAPDLTATCTDSDGINYKTKGTCTDKYGTYTDYCSGSLVMDYYCISSGCSTNKYQTTASLGESCVDGALIRCTQLNGGVEICGNGIDEDCNGSDLACATTTCTPAWLCTGWSTCVDGQETRICVDDNKCGTTDGKPAEAQSCTITLNATTGAATLKTNINIFELVLVWLRGGR